MWQGSALSTVSSQAVSEDSSPHTRIPSGLCVMDFPIVGCTAATGGVRHNLTSFLFKGICCETVCANHKLDVLFFFLIR